MNAPAGPGGGEHSMRFNDHEHRYELLIDGELAAYVSAHGGNGTVELPHTYTMPTFRGRGLAAQIVNFALDDLSARGQAVVPTCWFVAEYIDSHPEFLHLLT